MAQHTPVPWEIHPLGSFMVRNANISMLSDKPSLVCTAETAEDAQFIVQACNEYQPLIDALEDVAQELGNAIGWEDGLEAHDCREILEMVEKALAKAREEK